MIIKYEDKDDTVTMPDGKAFYAYVDGVKMPIGGNSDSTIGYPDWDKMYYVSNPFTAPTNGFLLIVDRNNSVYYYTINGIEYAHQTSSGKYGVFRDGFIFGGGNTTDSLGQYNFDFIPIAKGDIVAGSYGYSGADKIFIPARKS